MSAPKRRKLRDASIPPAPSPPSSSVKILLIHEKAEFENEVECTRYKVILCSPSDKPALLLRLSNTFKPDAYIGPNVHYAMISYVEWRYGHLGQWCDGDPRIDRLEELAELEACEGELRGVMRSALGAMRVILDAWIDSHDHVFAFPHIEPFDNMLGDVLGEYLDHVASEITGASALYPWLRSKEIRDLSVEALGLCLKEDTSALGFYNALGIHHLRTGIL